MPRNLVASVDGAHLMSFLERWSASIARTKRRAAGNVRSGRTPAAPGCVDIAARSSSPSTGSTNISSTPASASCVAQAVARTERNIPALASGWGAEKNCSAAARVGEVGTAVEGS